MKKKLFFLLIPLLISGMTGCVKYNGQGKPSKSTNTSEKADSSKDNSKSESASDSEVNPSSSADLSSGSEVESSSVAPQPSENASDPNALPKGTEVKIYLALGPTGLYKGEKGKAIEAKHLENAVELNTKVGDLLPTDADITSTVSGSKFMIWVAYHDNGKLNEYLTVPGYDGKVLHASFSKGNGGSQASITPTDSSANYEEPETGSLPTTGYGFKFSDNSYFEAVRVEDFEDFEQYAMFDLSFKKDQIFQLYNFQENAGWIVGVRGGINGAEVNMNEYIECDYTNFRYKVLKDFDANSVYIKMKWGADEIWFNVK